MSEIIFTVSYCNCCMYVLNAYLRSLHSVCICLAVGAVNELCVCVGAVVHVEHLLWYS